ncbi:tyrosine-protein kinase RYK-like [Ptychodera flava]|uniref:tyrosine-protein kinase RYK-like n=1 Tax=Ptychodera flava TaxID=63121 RepID=UPI003969C3C0
MARRRLLSRTVFCLLYLSLLNRFGVKGNFNLYMNDEEVERLLGLPSAQLYYVREGTVNDNALHFELPVPYHVDCLNFTWFTTTESQMFYSMQLISEDLSILQEPHVSIPLDGEVPQTESVFQVMLICAGSQETEVELTIQLKISLHSYSAKNITTLNFKRRKFCSQESGNENKGVLIQGTTSNEAFLPSDNSSLSVAGNQPSTVTSTSVFYIAVGVVCGTIFLIAMIVAFIYVQSMKSTDRVSQISCSAQLEPHQHDAYPIYDKMDNSVRPKNVNEEAFNSMSRYHPVNDIKTSDFKSKLKEISVKRSQITLGDLLHEGTFGRVYHGYIVSSTCESDSHEEEKEVFIKTVTDQASEDQRLLLFKESSMLHEVKHRNILPIMHVCFDDEKEPLMLFLYMSNGNLKHYLKNGRLSDAHQGLSTRDLVLIAIQITKGMQYLGKLNIIHKDLATRNCVIDDNQNIKITDNALARDLFPQDYTCLGDNENRPVKWLAIESLIEKKYYHASDVWAYGVTLWELMTLGQTPYADVDPFEMASYLKNGYRMAQPANCPDELFSIMACCWAQSPDDRPKFTHLTTILNDFHRALGIYI